MRYDVVVTGLGAVTPLGRSARQSWRRALEGCSGIRAVSRFDASRLRTRIAGEAPDLEPTEFMDARLAQRVDRFIHLGVAAACMAAKDAGLSPKNGSARSRLAVTMGNTFGGAQQLERGFDSLAQGYDDRLSPYFVPGALGNMAAGMVAMTLGAGGPNVTVNEACASGASAIGLGLQMLRTGEADAVVAGGCEAPITHLLYCGYHALRATTARNDEPARASRPFDRDRDGFVPAEGAAALVLETRDAAERRGVRPYATLAGFGSTCDAYHMTRPEPTGDGATRCMRLAIEDAGLEPGDIDSVNAHGTATRLNDSIEAHALTRVFGSVAERMPVAANKSLMGHTVGAAGAIEAAFSVLSLRDQVVPPTANLEHPDPECGLRGLSTRARQLPMRAVLSNSFGFGGANASLVFRRLEGPGGR